MTAWDGTIPETLTPLPAGVGPVGVVVGAVWEDEPAAAEPKPRFPDPFDF